MIIGQIKLKIYAFTISDQDVKIPPETPLTPPEAPLREHLKRKLLKIIKRDFICFIKMHFYINRSDFDV
jgi:hypothetical protein